MIQNLFNSKMWKWKLRVILYHTGLWSLFSTTRLGLQYWRKQAHEPEFQILKNFPKNGLLIDIGANAGQSVLSARIYHPTLRIISFEPNQLHRSDLKWIQFLVGKKRFQFHLMALGNASTTLPFYYPTIDGVPLTQEATLVKETLLADPTTLHRIAGHTGSSKLAIHETKIQVLTFDEWMAQQENQTRVDLRPDLVKLDVQRSELNVLKGMTQTLEKFHPTLMIENGIHIPEITDFLSRFNYQPYQYDPHQNQLIPFKSRDLNSSEIMNVLYISPHQPLFQHLPIRSISKLP